MSDYRRETTKATEEQIIKLAHIRTCPREEAARMVAATYAENLKLSRGTSMESYWRLMVDVADQQVASELSAREHSS